MTSTSVASWLVRVHAWGSAALTVAAAVLAVGAVVVTVVALWRARRLARTPQLVMVDLTDGIGGGESAALAHGVGQRVREGLNDALRDTYGRARREVEQDAELRCRSAF